MIFLQLLEYLRPLPPPGLHPQTRGTSCLDDSLRTLPRGLCSDITSSEGSCLTIPVIPTHFYFLCETVCHGRELDGPRPLGDSRSGGSRGPICPGQDPRFSPEHCLGSIWLVPKLVSSLLPLGLPHPFCPALSPAAFPSSATSSRKPSNLPVAPGTCFWQPSLRLTCEAGAALFPHTRPPPPPPQGRLGSQEAPLSRDVGGRNK